MRMIAVKMLLCYEYSWVCFYLCSEPLEEDSPLKSDLQPKVKKIGFCSLHIFTNFVYS